MLSLSRPESKTVVFTIRYLLHFWLLRLIKMFVHWHSMG